MPVRLRQDGQVPSTDPRVIDLEDYLTGRENFKKHYFLAACNPIFGGQDIAISWDSLNNAVNTFCSTYTINPSTVALRFVYCYDPNMTSLYLRVQLCTMVPQPGPPTSIYNLVDTQCAWYQITQGSLVPTQDTNLDDSVYLNNFYYCDNHDMCNTATLQQLSSDGGVVFARTVTFPWIAEILQMYIDNGSPSGATISFGSCSYVKKSDGSTETIWPHGLVLYLSDYEGNAFLNNEQYIVLFANKGCDMGTLCPPHCNVYISPLLA
jgi:hypothetical protein